SDYLMLSGETASGRYPVESVRMMKNVIQATEKSELFKKILLKKGRKRNE
ncbi:MAG: pyruvate kinase, partial [Candidatus Aureabacteria bacterium]|nr:pyruvate kinase [Candidatus Auribacterota bacterium]